MKPADEMQAPHAESYGETGIGSSFSEKSIRMAFIRKVYAILMCQLAITVAIICIFVYIEPVKLYAQENIGLMIGCIVVTLVLVIALSCCSILRRKFPHNIICLLVFTILESVLLGTVSGFFDAPEVMWAVGICTVICVAVSIYAFQTKYDFTTMGGLLFVLLLCLISFGFMMIFFHNDILRPVYSCLGALLFSFYLVYDTQLLIGGRHKLAISPEEYVFAALSLYLDIINIFLYVLQLVASR